jgi:hypothetical protein
VIFLLFDVETCSCTGRPTLNDPILAFGIRECSFEGCRSDTDVIYRLQNQNAIQ